MAEFEKINALLEQLPKSLAGRVAQAGWFPGAVYEDGTPVAYVAAIQEYGSPANGVPPRPFIRPTIEQSKGEWVDEMGKGVRAVIRGRVTSEQMLEVVGLRVASDIQARIEAGPHLPLSPITLMLRKWAREGRVITGKTVGEAAAAVAAGESDGGVNSDPLRDTGLLIATLNSAVGDA